jgi:phage-related protein
VEPWYFIFNGVDSRAMGVHVIKYPPIIRPAERLKYVTIPGRAGDLTQSEGENIFDAYTRAMEVSNARGFSLDAVRKWLRGRGTMIIGNEPQFAYQVDLGAQCQYDKIIRGIWGGPLQMRTQPYKLDATPESPITVTASPATITNPGDVRAKPRVVINGSGNITLTMGGKTLIITGAQSGWVYDAALEWVTDANGVPMFNVSSGTYPDLPVGQSAVLFTGNVTSLEITPRWRYL